MLLHTLKRHARNRDVHAVCFIILTIGLLAVISSSEWLFESLGFLDTWYYIAFGYDYLDKDFLHWYYKISRLPWILLQFTVRHVFSYLASEYVLMLGCLSAGALGIYFCISPLFGRQTGVTIALMLAVYTHYHGSGGWNYHNTLSGPLYIWTYYLFMKLALTPDRGRRALVLPFVSGVFLALTIHSNVVFSNFALLIGVMYLTLRCITDGNRLSWRRILPDVLMALGGVIAITVLLGAVNKAVGRNFLFFMGQFSYAASFVTHNELLKVWWKPLSGDWLKTAYYLALPFAVFVISSICMLVASLQRRLLEAKEQKIAFCMLLQHVIICLIWTMWHQMGQVALDWNYFAYPLMFSSFMALAAFPAFFGESVLSSSIKRAGEVLFFMLIPLILVLSLISYVSMPAFGKNAFGIWQILYPAAIFMIACVLFLFARKTILVFIAAVLFFSWGNVQSSYSLGIYAYNNKSTIRRDHYLAILKAREQIMSREKRHMLVNIWFDESEELKVQDNESIKIANLAYALASTGFQYYIKAWPLPKVEEIAIPDVLNAKIWEKHLLVVVSTNQNTVGNLIELHKSAGLNVAMHDIVEMNCGRAKFNMDFIRFENLNIPAQ